MKVWFEICSITLLALAFVNMIIKEYSAAQHFMIMGFCILILLKLENIR